MNIRTALALGVLAALLGVSTARADDSFRITAGGNQDWGPQTGGLDQTGSTQLEATGTMTDSHDPVLGHADYAVQAGPGIARASMHGNVTVRTGEAYPFNPSLQAVANTELTVNGPESEITTSLNLHVDGVIDSMSCPGPPCGQLNAFIFAPSGTTAGAGAEFTSAGAGRENELGLTLDPIPGGYHVHGDVTSRPFGIRTGTPNAFGIVLNLSGRFGGNPGGETFGGSFEVSFAPRGPVLNVPAGYTVTGNGVVNNRWDDPFSGDVVVSNCQDPALAQVTTVAGSLVLRCDGAEFPNLTHIGGDVVLDGNQGGDLDLDGVSVGGAIDVSGTGGDLTIDVGSVGGPIDVSGTGGDLTVDAGSVGGAIDVSGTGGDLTIDAGTVGGDLDITDNSDAGVIDVGGGQLGGDLTITDNGTAVVNANDSLTVSGDADVETGQGGMLDLSGVEADGDETVETGGAVTANTAGGTTDVSTLGGTAAMHVVLPDGAFDQPVAFTITPHGDDPAEGEVDPIAGDAFAFAVPALNANAHLSFTIDLAALDAATRAALLAGIANGNATIATKPDGSVYGAFSRCTGAQTPDADHCVNVTLLPTTTEPAFATFDGVAGHFSTYAVALLSPRPRPVTPATPTPGSIASRPSAAQIRALLRTQITPRGKAGKIGALLKRAYRLQLRALTAGTAKVEWYRGRKLIASGRRSYAAAGLGTISVKLTAAGRKALRHPKRLSLTAKGTFTSAPDPPVTATRAFTLRR